MKTIAVAVALILLACDQPGPTITWDQCLKECNGHVCDYYGGDNQNHGWCLCEDAHGNCDFEAGHP